MSCERTIYVVLRKAVRYWNTPVVARFTKKAPKLRAGELAVKIELHIPSNIFDLPAASIIVDERNLVRPTVEAK